MRALVDQVRDAVGEHPRLAGSGAGDDEQRAVAVHDRVELIRVETGHIGVGGVLIRAESGHLEVATVRVAFDRERL